jgi:hypothetical protein
LLCHTVFQKQWRLTTFWLFCISALFSSPSPDKGLAISWAAIITVIAAATAHPDRSSPWRFLNTGFIIAPIAFDKQVSFPELKEKIRFPAAMTVFFVAL